MQITVKTEGKEWGFVEKFRFYEYDGKGYVYALCSITAEGSFSPVYGFKEMEFVPFKEIDKSVGGFRYLKAKKPLYSKIGEGFIVELRAGVNFSTGEYLPDKSSFTFFTIRDGEGITSDMINLSQVMDISDTVRAMVEQPLKLLAETKGDRIKFLKLRGEMVE